MSKTGNSAIEVNGAAVTVFTQNAEGNIRDHAPLEQLVVLSNLERLIHAA